MIITLTSILILTLAAWIIRRNFNWKVCPICVGVFLTWAWMLSAIFFGILSIEKYEIIIAILMGASIGGIVTKLEKIFQKWKGSKKSESEKVDALKNKMENCC